MDILRAPLPPSNQSSALAEALDRTLPHCGTAATGGTFAETVVRRCLAWLEAGGLEENALASQHLVSEVYLPCP